MPVPEGTEVETNPPLGIGSICSGFLALAEAAPARIGSLDTVLAAEPAEALHDDAQGLAGFLVARINPRDTLHPFSFDLGHVFLLGGKTCSQGWISIGFTLAGYPSCGFERTEEREHANDAGKFSLRSLTCATCTCVPPDPMGERIHYSEIRVSWAEEQFPEVLERGEN